ncbi:uncharacterized protein PFL1_02094 [Pseudozyma flocculosa PF-1]|uniref:Ribonuclease n=1 Tax=Pseudozyma flocculosa TaxID=84751 RepID=A0A5C3F018_9BASI|nr:uncharacterized protein PFL1_02094 [Pseudozyma flocculosa PF-1]EPQ30570.1 hypothetical protein PFL1_02094 [Pseudozyma flocculosa PF-1]SPO37662.1 related to 35 kDa ribonuclease H [Pseudozyma flocculosa]
MPRIKRTRSSRSQTESQSQQDPALDRDDGTNNGDDDGLPSPPPPIPSDPKEPIVASYTYASPIPSECSRTVATGSTKVPCVLGVDEAGRGPVLGPLVYGIAYCPLEYQDELKQIGFADSKALTAEKRSTLLSALIDTNTHLGWAVRVMSPQDISSGMLRRRPVNLNAQSSQATVALIAGVLESGVDVTEIYVDTVGDPTSYSRLLSSNFPRHPHIKWTVTSKADAIYPIVGAASIAAKVTRDRCIDEWRYAEAVPGGGHAGASQWQGQGQGQGRKGDDTVLADRTNGEERQEDGSATASSAAATAAPPFPPPGSGYPSDPNTVSYLKAALDPVFGWPGIVRFSWATAKTMLDEKVRLPSASASSASSAGASRGTKRKAMTRSSSRSKGIDLSAGGDADGDAGQTPPDDKPAALSSATPLPSFSRWGTRIPATGTRGYKVKWTHEPVAISSFFSAASTKSAKTAATPQSPSSTSSSLRSMLGGRATEVEAMALHAMLRDEAAPVGAPKSSDANVGKVSRDLGITSTSFPLLLLS